VAFFRGAVLLRLVALLTAMIVLVVGALLIHAAAAYWKLALASRAVGFTRSCGSFVDVSQLVVRAPCVGHVRLSLERAQLLLVGFASGHDIVLDVAVF
jgi:hypothetical protein